MISVERLNRSYGHLKAVREVSFSLKTGEVVGLLGPNGAGKTTIMKMLCGFLEPSSGRVTINGADITHETKLAQSYIGYLPENLPIYPEMTVAAYLDYAAGLRAIEPANRAAEIRRVITATDLTDKALAKIGSLSRGLKQRVGVAQALLGNPKVLVLDEPTNGLDPTQTLQMRALIRKLAESSTVILSTHILSEVEAVCDRVLMVRRGELVLDAKLAELRQAGDIVLRTSLAEVKALLGAQSGIDQFTVTEEQDAVRHCRIRPAADCNPMALRAQIARMVIEAGGELYEIAAEKRDLESLFRELNNVGGLSNAA